MLFRSDDGGLSQSKQMLSITQTLPFPGKKTLDGRIGRQQMIATEREYRVQERELIRNVTLAFYGVLAWQKKTTAVAELVTLTQSLAETTRKRVAAGDTTEQEQLRAEIEVDRAAVETAAAQRELATAQRHLAHWLGCDELSPVTGELPVTATLCARPAGHPQLAAAAAQRDRAELEVRRAKLEALPDLTLGVAGGRDRDRKSTRLNSSHVSESRMPSSA